MEELMATISDAISGTYLMIDRTGLSPAALVGLGLFFAVTFVYATRELASWFFKIDRLRREISDLRKMLDTIQRELKAPRPDQFQKSQIGIEATPETEVFRFQSSNPPQINYPL
jgi:hypothetical protein